MDGSVTQLIRDLRNGSDSTAEMLWYRFEHRLKALAGRKLGRQGGIHEPDDIAIDAFYSFLNRHRDGKFPLLGNRDEAWRMLVVIVIRKAINVIKYSRRKCRFAPLEQVAIEMISEKTNYRLPSQASPDTEELAMKEIYEQLMMSLKDQQLKDIAAMKLHGLSNVEISSELSCSLATVERRLRVIRATWESEEQR